MPEYPVDHRLNLTGPTLIYIDSEGSLIELPLNNYQAQSILTHYPESNNEASQTLNPPLGHVVVRAADSYS